MTVKLGEAKKEEVKPHKVGKIAVSADGLFSKGMRISQGTTAQDSNVFHRQAEARLQLRVGADATQVGHCA
jgi:hypothetical protein